MQRAGQSAPSTDQLKADMPIVLNRTIDPAHIFALRIIRTMAIGGVNDARAAAMLMGQFGRAHRRPLVLMRAMMLELARVSYRQIRLAPPCCRRITTDEALIIAALSRSEPDFGLCYSDSAALLGHDDVLGAATCFQAVSQCFADMGYPLSSFAHSLG